MFERILVALDPSPSHESALRMAGGLARSTGAEVRVLHVVPFTVAGDAVVSLETDAEGTMLLEAAVRMLQALGLKAEGRLTRGVTQVIPRLISDAADEFKADLLVLSPHHRSSLAALLAPRVSDAVVHASDIAVLLAPERPAEQE
ncbi:universal stress protein [Streptomyces mirabilis]|uniref:Universal stress protein n=1 Tax=Streptomyces mirabilis TaxID=68239 RepID=A0ABU3V679_9ACTN|nr:universal stress protein [Streptomyces mirabilis]MCX5355658.1 universal stress protein [Streptomyces mirabilis]MDU9001304.1 universal stress protein [Streptomyces mirabilis]